MHQPVLSALAAGGGHPLIDIDGTAFIQFGLFLIMAFLANQWLFKPYLRMREDRHEAIEGAQKKATELRAEADAHEAEYQAKLAAARSRAYDEQRKIRSEATAFQREVTEKARTEANTAIEEARGKIRDQAETARNELMPKAGSLARAIASKLLSREVA